jgi:hypothetical protein
LAVFDTDQNITWTQDANINGADDWVDQAAWAAGLTLGGFSEWRLPMTLQPDASCASQNDPGGGLPIQGSGFDCTGSEMGHLFNVDGITASTPGLFTNVISSAYWSGTEFAPVTTSAWAFGMGNGLQGGSSKSDPLFALAVHDGNIGGAVVPVPAAVWLFGSALGLLGWMRWRKAE